MKQTKTGFDDTRFAEAKGKIAALAESVKPLARHGFLRGPVEDFERVFGEKRREKRLHVAVCGAHSAGKSTLASCLTGRKDIPIGKGVTTDETAEYECGDWTIVDTPGICAGRPEHDKTSLRYMARADLLVYMIPAKGFSPEVARNFKETIMARYSGKTMLVMNRIGRIEEANLPAKRQEVAELLGGEEALEAYRFCMVDVKDYMEGVAEGDEERVRDSRMAGFKERLDDFLRERGHFGKSAALLDVLDDFTAVAEAVCQNQEARDEIGRRQCRALRHAMERYRQAFMDAKGRMLEFLGGERAEMLELFAEQSPKLEEKAKTFADRCARAADDPVFRDDLERLFGELRAEVQDIDEQVQRLERRLSLAFEGGAGHGFDMERWKDWASQLGGALANTSKETLVQIVHFCGGKFKPWGAGKLLKCIKGVGATLPIVAGCIGMVVDLHADQKMEEGRAELRRSFDEIEAAIREFYDGWEDTKACRSLQAGLDKLEAAEARRQRTNAEKDAVLEKLGTLKAQTASCRADLAGLAGGGNTEGKGA